MTLRVEEEKWSVGFFFKSVSYCSENTGVKIVGHLYICIVENLFCILTLPVF